MKQRTWITYLAGAIALTYGIVGAVFGLHGADGMMDYIISGLGIVGFRRAMVKGQRNGPA